MAGLPGSRSRSEMLSPTSGIARVRTNSPPWLTFLTFPFPASSPARKRDGISVRNRVSAMGFVSDSRVGASVTRVTVGDRNLREVK